MQTIKQTLFSGWHFMRWLRLIVGIIFIVQAVQVHDSLGYKGYGPDSWGLTSSYSVKGYAGHAPSAERDLGVIAPTAAISSIPYTPEKSIAAIKHWYNDMKDKLWGPYGFYDAFSETNNWYPQKYLAIDQGPQVVMIENYRSGLLWKLFMSCPEVQQGLNKLGFTFSISQ